MSADGNKELVRRLVEEAVRDRNLEVLDEIAAGPFAEVARRWVAPFRGAFPDFEMEIVALIAEDDKVVGHFRCSGRASVNGWVCRRPGGDSRRSTRSTCSRFAMEGCYRRLGLRTTCPVSVSSGSFRSGSLALEVGLRSNEPGE